LPPLGDERAAVTAAVEGPTDGEIAPTVI